MNSETSNKKNDLYKLFLKQQEEIKNIYTSNKMDDLYKLFPKQQ